MHYETLFALQVTTEAVKQFIAATCYIFIVVAWQSINHLWCQVLFPSCSRVVVDSCRRYVLPFLWCRCCVRQCILLPVWMSSLDTVTEQRYAVTIQYRSLQPRDLRKPRRDSSIQTRVLVRAVVVRYGEGLLQRLSQLELGLVPF